MIAWDTKNWVQLFELELEHPVYTLNITPDNEFLIASADKKDGQLSTLRLEENLDSIRLNIPRKTYENTEMNVTNDGKYIIAPLPESNCIEIWNVESKVLSHKITQV